VTTQACVGWSILSGLGVGQEVGGALHVMELIAGVDCYPVADEHVKEKKMLKKLSWTRRVGDWPFSGAVGRRSDERRRMV
jgi:hypothetical protein